MKDFIASAFEQFAFLGRMFNFSNATIRQDTAISWCWSVLLSTMTAFTSALNYSLGISITYFLILFVVMCVDYVTGIRAARKEKQPIVSKKGLRWVVKFFTYLMGFALITNLGRETAAMESPDFMKRTLGVGLNEFMAFIWVVIKIFFMIYILIWEIKSIKENYDRLGLDSKVLDFFISAFYSVSGLLAKKTNINPDRKDEKN